MSIVTNSDDAVEVTSSSVEISSDALVSVDDLPKEHEVQFEDNNFVLASASSVGLAKGTNIPDWINTAITDRMLEGTSSFRDVIADLGNVIRQLETGVNSQITSVQTELLSQNTKIDSNVSRLGDDIAAQLSIVNTKVTDTEARASSLDVLTSNFNTVASSAESYVVQVAETLNTKHDAQAVLIDGVSSTFNTLNGEHSLTADAVSTLNTKVGITGGVYDGTGILADLSTLQAQVDNKVSNHIGTYDVMEGSEVSDTLDLVNSADPYASWLAAESSTAGEEEFIRTAHIGDAYIKYQLNVNGDREYVASYKFIKVTPDDTSPYSTDTDGYTWALVTDTDAQEAYTAALKSAALADGKATIYTGTLAERDITSGGWSTVDQKTNIGDVWYVPLTYTWPALSDDPIITNYADSDVEKDTYPDKVQVTSQGYRWSGVSWFELKDGVAFANAEAITSIDASLGDDFNASSTVAQTITAVGDKIDTNFKYDSNTEINGSMYYSGFGLQTSATSGGTGTSGDPYRSEFWIDAEKLKFTNSANSGTATPFEIDAAGTVPKIRLNGSVEINGTAASDISAYKGEIDITAINGTTLGDTAHHTDGIIYIWTVSGWVSTEGKIGTNEFTVSIFKEDVKTITPSVADSGNYDVNGTFTEPSGWTLDKMQPASFDNTVYESRSTHKYDPNTDTFSIGSWSSPVAVGGSVPEIGTDFFSADGNFIEYIYSKGVTTTPTIAVDGYESTPTITYTTTWKDDPSQLLADLTVDQVYVSKGVCINTVSYDTDGNTINNWNIPNGWSTPTKWNGLKGDSGFDSSVADNGDGTYTVTGVNGDIEITDGKSNNISWVLSSSNIEAILQNQVLVRTSSPSRDWGDGAYSEEVYTSGCVVSCTQPVTTDAMIGINSDPATNHSYNSIDYAFQLKNNNVLGIYENGSSIIADVDSDYRGKFLHIEYDNHDVRYYVNGVVKRTVSTTEGRSFSVDTSIAAHPRTIEGITFSSIGSAAVAPVMAAGTNSTTGRTEYTIKTFNNDGTVKDTEVLLQPLKNLDYYDGASGDFVSYVFKVSDTLPATPTDGSYNGVVETEPTGWTDTPTHTETQDVEWVITRRYVATTDTDGSVTWSANGVWSDPKEFYRKGDSGLKGDRSTANIQVAYRNDSDGDFTSYSFNTGSPTWLDTGSSSSLSSSISDSTVTHNMMIDIITGDTPRLGDTIEYSVYDTDGTTLLYTQKSYCDGAQWINNLALMVHGDAIVDGTLSANKVRTGVIYNGNTSEVDYTMKIDLDNGYIHIR